MKKILVIATSIMLIFSSCNSTVRLAKNDEEAAIQFVSPTQAAIFVEKENVVSGTDIEKHTDIANRLYNNYGPATEEFFIGRTNAQTFIFSSEAKSWYVDVSKLKKPFAMIIFDGYHKPQIEYNVSKYVKTVDKLRKPRPRIIEIDDNRSKFFLQSELTTNGGSLGINHFEKSCYEILFHVAWVGEDKSAGTKTYEVELYDVILTLSERLKESENFSRRLMYRYDWIQPRVNLEGQVVSIENKEELKDTWQEMKSYILEFYGGDVVENHLKEISREFDTDRSVYSSLSEYFFFGLLFPAIPETHGTPWERKRIIKLSPYDGEQFEEQAVYVKSIKGKRRYDIKGSFLPDNEAELETFEGYIIIPDNQTFPTIIDVNVSYKTGKIIVQWHFNLERR